MINKNKSMQREFYSLLEKHDIDFNDNTRALIDFFFSTEKHLSIQELETYAKENNTNIDAEPIKKLMELLCDYGFAKKITFQDGITRYEHLHLDDHHDHFICMRCHKVIEFRSEEIEEKQRETAKQFNFHPFGHRMEIHGLCNSCFGTPKVTMALSMVQPGGIVKIVEFLEKEKPNKPNCKRKGLFSFFNKNIPSVHNRLISMGLPTGTTATVISNHIGLVILGISGNRIAIGKGMSERILVELLN